MTVKTTFHAQGYEDWLKEVLATSGAGWIKFVNVFPVSGFSVRFDWSCESSFYRPVAAYSGTQSCDRQPELFSPFYERLGRAAISQPYCIATVSHLLFACSPPAVVRAIGTIIVNAFKHVFRSRRISHITVEGFKGIEPSFAHFYPSALVLICGVIIGVVTSCLNMFPCSINLGTCEPMRHGPFHRCLGPEASTRLRMAIVQIASFYYCLIAARASTEPLATGYILDGCELSKLTPANILHKFMHFIAPYRIYDSLDYTMIVNNCQVGGLCQN